MKHFWLCTCSCGMLLIFLPLLLPPPPLPATTTTTLLIELWIRTNTHTFERTFLSNKIKFPRLHQHVWYLQTNEKSKKMFCCLSWSQFNDKRVYLKIRHYVFRIFFSSLQQPKNKVDVTTTQYTFVFAYLIWYRFSLVYDYIYALPNSLRVCWAEWVSMIQ